MAKLNFNERVAATNYLNTFPPITPLTSDSVASNVGNRRLNPHNSSTRVAGADTAKWAFVVSSPYLRRNLEMLIHSSRNIGGHNGVMD
jgi:hypothetical protein